MSVRSLKPSTGRHAPASKSADGWCTGVEATSEDLRVRCRRGVVTPPCSLVLTLALLGFGVQQLQEVSAGHGGERRGDQAGHARSEHQAHGEPGEIHTSRQNGQVISSPIEWRSPPVLRTSSITSAGPAVPS